MRSHAIHVCMILYLNVLVINIASGISLRGLKDEPGRFGKNDRLLIFNRGMKKPGVRSEGIFERFLRNLLDTLINHFPINKLAKYCGILHHKLSDMDYKYTRRLAVNVYDLSKMYRDEIRNELIEYRNELVKKSPHRVEFLTSMNEMFTLQENLLFDDYIHDLRNYGARDKLHITQETANLLQNVIVGTIRKRSRKEQKALERKLRNAIKEYRDDTDYSHSTEDFSD